MKQLWNISFATVLCTLLASPALATIYLVASDPATKSVGMAVISSGPVITYNPHPLNGIKGIGFVGWSGSALNISPSMDKKVFEMMKQLTSPEQIAAYVDSQIHNKYSRYSFISTNGTMGYVFPPTGCGQPECGVAVSATQQFFIMGGGLQPDVVNKSVEIYENIHQNNLPFECKLMAGVQTIINVGGEIKEFAEAGIAIDNPNRPQQDWFKSVGAPESKIVAKLRSQIESFGINCPAMEQVELKAKPKQMPSSLDLN